MIPQGFIEAVTWLIVVVGAFAVVTLASIVAWLCFDHWFRHAKLAADWMRFLSWRRKQRAKDDD